ncbi:unnamed protein product [Camellia sinensis]
MRESDSPIPTFFAMSNPTMNAECTAVDAFNHAGENIVFASGSPFKNVDLGNGKVGLVNQANNMYLFPGIGMGALLSSARLISDGMSQAVSECAILYPPMRRCAQVIAARNQRLELLFEQQLPKNWQKDAVMWDPESSGRCQKEETVEYVKPNMWYPVYSPLLFMGNKVPIISLSVCVCTLARYFSADTIPMFCSHSNIHDVTMVLKPRVVIYMREKIVLEREGS